MSRPMFRSCSSGLVEYTPAKVNTSPFFSA
jgi:hypothetical protein